jgi:RNA polymerase sigma-70 factor (ECF subfamily)
MQSTCGRRCLSTHRVSQARSTAVSNSRRIVLLPGPAGDRALVARLLAGEAEAYRDCYEAHAPRVMALLTRMLRDSAKAEEILQETFEAVFAKVAQYRGDAQLGTWIAGIAIRRALNALRDESRRIPAAPDDPADVPDEGIESAITSRDLGRRILGLLDRLPADKRIALLLYAEGYTAAEIAELTKAPRATVLARLSRGRAQVVALAAAAGIGEDDTSLEEPRRG